MKPSSFRLTVVATLLALPGSAVLTGLAGSAATRAGTAEAADAPAAPAPAPAAPTPAKRPLDPKERDKLIPLLRGYLDVENPDGFKARTQLVDALKKLRETGCDVLAERETLMTVIYPARAFAPAFEKKLLGKDDKDAKIELDTATNVVAVRWGDFRLSISLPAGYEDARKGKKLPTLAPFPAIVTLHDLEDFMGEKDAKDHPGSEVIKRRWNRKATKVPDGWFIFAPVATRAQFTKDGRIDPTKVPLRELWTRYHVDVDRVVLEGGSDALALAAAQPNFFSGLIVRNADKAELPCPQLVRNLSTLRVYVVGGPDAPIVKTLEANGFPKERLTVAGPEGLPDWLAAKDLRRVVPKSFRWTVKDADVHSFAHWVNIEQVEAGETASATLQVEVVDTAEAPNTIQVTSSGVRSISLFLSDEIVDLNREVKLVINATPVREVKIHSPRNAEGLAVRLPARFDVQRSLDNVFDLMPEFWPRRRMYYGWLFPLAFMKVPVRTDRAETDGAGKPPAPPDGAPTTPPVDEAAALREKNALNYFTKAEENEAIGDVAKALKLYRKAVEEGDSSVKAKAEAKVKELEAKAGGGAAVR